MTEFVGHAIGTRHYSYPETPRGAGALAFARNVAGGPAGEVPTDIAVSPGTQVPWSGIAVGTAPSVNVPITPKVTGHLRITGVLTIVNVSGTPRLVLVQLQIGGVTPVLIPEIEQPTIPAGDIVAVPILFETAPPQTPIGTTSNIQILLTASGAGLGLVQLSSILDIQEVGLETG